MSELSKKLLREQLENKIIPNLRLDETDELCVAFDENIKILSKLPKNVIDSFKIKNTLNTKIWSDDKLIPEIKTKLQEIADEFYKTLELPSNIKIKDIIFTGSLANFNWSEFSDVDLHLVLDFEEINDDLDFTQNYFMAQKNLWNETHNITINDYPVELYVQDVDDELEATAIYSIKKDKWLLKPEKESFKLDVKNLKLKAEKIMYQIRDIRDKFKAKDYQYVIDKSTALKDKIKKMRKSGLEKGGEFSMENLVFKALRRTDFMEIIANFKNQATDMLLSLNESNP
jgi:hypothetical protein